ncbi:MAG: sialate O-acetylesterase [Lachnospiraceae bacterium]|nr:sialate O-acetylesterase [Lachnospiraceae bacterium]
MNMRKKAFTVILPFLLAVVLWGCDENSPSDTITIDIPASTENDITAGELGTKEVTEEQPEEQQQEQQQENEVTVSGNEINPSSVSDNQIDEEINVVEEDKVKKTEDGKIIVDLVIFMGQSNMSGTGGNPKYAPTVPEGHGYEFRAVSDPTRLYPITEPFGINENNINGIMDYAVAKKGSLVSAFANKYYEETGVPIVGVSASQGGTDTHFWMKESTVSDLVERVRRAQVWLESNNYYIRKQYALWLQGESDSFQNITIDGYKQNMDNIIRPLFFEKIQKVFIITTGRSITSKDFYDTVIDAQIELCKDSGYYALATTVLSAVSTEYMVDEVHYNQSVLNLLGEQSAESAAFYTNNTREMCLYDYENHETYIPNGFDYSGEEEVEPLDVNNECGLTKYYD